MEENSNLQCQEVISICDSIDQVIYITDPDTYEVLFANKALKKVLGEVVGKKCYEAFQGLGGPCPFCTNKYIFGENLGKTYIWEFQNRNDKHWYHCIDKAIRWTDGRWVRYEMAIDINERKLIEEALGDSEARYRLLFERNLAGIYRSCVDLRTWKARRIDCNDAFARILGYPSCEELLDQEVLNVFFSEAEYKEYIAKLIKYKILNNLELRLRRKDNREVWVLVNVGLREDVGAQIAFIEGAMIDISERKQIENTLKESEEKFKNLAEKSLVGIYIIQDGVFKYVNAKFAEVFGYTAEELINKSPKDITFSQDWPIVEENIRKRLQGEVEAMQYEFRGITKNKDILNIEIYGSRIQFGGYPAVMGSLLDISERKRQEEALKESEQKFRLLFDRVFDAIVIIDKKGKIVNVNDTACKLLGYTKEELLNLSLKDIHPVWEIGKIQVAINRALENGVDYMGETAFVSKSGKTIPVESGGVTINIGNETYIAGSFRDITERKRSNEELQRQREELQIIFDSVPAMIFYKDKQNRMLKVNNDFAKVMGMPKEEIEGKNCFDLWSAGQAEKYFCDDKKVIESGLARLDIIEHLETAAGVRWVCTQKIPYRDKDGNVIGVLGFATDITERKHAEEEKEKSDKELIKSNKRLKRLALKDPHTGLFNHRYFQEVIEREFDRSKRNGHNLSLIMLDLDYFKSINDVYGHFFGDLVLKQFAVQIKRMVRGYDIVVRYGGEEFVIVCPATTRSSALVLAQRILEAINLYNFGNSKNTVKLKLSLAVVSYPEDHILNGMDMFKVTDHILNKAKESGGNRVYCSLDLKKEKPHNLENVSKSSDVKSLKEKLEKLTKRANQSLIEATFAFAKTIDLKDHYTGEHVEKTVQYATEIANLLGFSRNDVELVKQASILHDLGKIGISEKILLKKSKLTREEFEEVKKHPRIGVEIIRPIHFLHSIVPLVLYHHERWDGKGYPYGLKGEEIPIGARIIAIADVYQALISNRPYHKAYTENEAVSIIKNGSGTQFDPHIVITFLSILKQKK